LKTAIAVSSPADERLPPPPSLDLGRSAVFADLDGTLAPIEATPGGVSPDADRRRLLDALSRRLSGRLAVVSGRALDDLDRLLDGRVPAIGAVHGLVRRTAAGVIEAPAPDIGADQARAAMLAFAKADAGLLVEDKGPAVALHYRRSPQAREACLELAQGLAARLGLVVQPGDMVVELRLPGPDKGDAVQAFMGEAPFKGFMPVYIGDDFTDESGFRAARANGGFGVIVGARRPTDAAYGLADVDAAKNWLAAAIEAGR